MKFHEDNKFRAAFLADDPSAVNAFVGHFVTVLGKMGHAQGLSREESEDAVQECFSVFFKKVNDIRPDVKLSTFLFGVFLNSVRETRRKRGRHESHGDLASIETLIDQQYDDKGHWKPGVGPKPIENVLKQEESRHLENCLEGLPEKHKTAILLTLQGEEDPKDLCHIRDVSYANFRQLLSRARNALRLCLENYVGEP
ncbi:MAG: sigma-70 family RNA polymerase sigma factor [Bacteriovoracaceae bacterium]|nr:sigma-70 family RNA polymerase sigma factor [Bacteriovoracaceae bacterium]